MAYKGLILHRAVWFVKHFVAAYLWVDKAGAD
jgi:hypothetical protein